MNQPEHIACIGDEVAIRWTDGKETFYKMERLRAASPSAENKGESDLMGVKYGGTDQTHFPGVTVTNWDIIGGYAIQFRFSDGHNTGLYSYEMLRELGEI